MMVQRLLALAVFVAIWVGALLHLLDAPSGGDAVWAASTAVILVPLTWSVVSSLRHGDVGVDAIALHRHRDARSPSASTWPARSWRSCSPAGTPSRPLRGGARGAS